MSSQSVVAPSDSHSNSSSTLAPPWAAPRRITDPLLTQAQAAELLTLKPATLEVWRSTKRYALRYVKVGRFVRYRLSDVEAFIRSREVAA